MAAIIGQLSASAALFQHHGTEADVEGETLLQPVPIDEQLLFASDLVTTQRYRGKTNERLTRAMLNIGLATAGIDISAPTGTVLDPMCGRGTTLNWALAYGLNATGIDADRPSLDQHATFLQTWAKRARLPHKMQRFRPGNGEKRNSSLEVAPDRAALKDGSAKLVQTFTGDGGDTGYAIKKSSIDTIVSDLPYGVQHRGAGDGPDRDEPGTVELIERLLPTWQRWLKPSGSVCLAWNTKRAGRRDVSKALATGGFSPVTATGGYSMRHVVDSTIDRDVIVATRQR